MYRGSWCFDGGAVFDGISCGNRALPDVVPMVEEVRGHAGPRGVRRVQLPECLCGLVESCVRKHTRPLGKVQHRNGG